MYTIVKDNKDILRYRGLLSPGALVAASQRRAAELALLSLSNLNSNALGSFTTGLPTDTNKMVSTNPFMRLLPEDGGASDGTLYDFYFPYVPQSIDYSDMSDEIAEIPRAGTTPIVTFRGHRLMKVSMEFLIAVPYDGLLLDVEESLKIIRIFATNSQRSVVFYHLDQMLTQGYNYRKGPYSRPSAFNITDLNINARQRNADGKITQAIESLSLVENRNPVIVVSPVPPFKKKRPTRLIPPRVPTTRTQRVAPYTETANAIGV
jgi:hypothetical protein